MFRRIISILFASVSVVAWAASAPEDKNPPLFQAIRANDQKRVSSLLASGASASQKNSSGATALMYAALYADTQCMKLLLDKGADANAANAAGVTALMWGVNDPSKVKLLLSRGAAPNARSQEGRTALMVAARQDGSLEVIKLLASKGADLNAKDPLGGTALMMASEAGDLEVVKYLVEKGAKLDEQPGPGYGAPRFGTLKPEGFDKIPPDAKGATALMIAAGSGNREIVRYLLAKGADAKLKSFGVFNALHAGVQLNDPEMVKLLLDKGADVNAPEFRGATPLILAAAQDESGPVVRLLLERGADLNAKDRQGNTALAWALKRGDTDTAKMLREAGAADVRPAATMSTALMAASANESTNLRRAIEKSLALLQPSGVQFVKKSGCISCHHQSIAQIAVSAARTQGIAVDESVAKQTLNATLSVLAPHKETMLQAVPSVPASTIVSSYALIGLAAERYPADETTDALVHELAARQRHDGRWHAESSRPPLDHGDITATALCMRSLQLYGLPGRKQEFDRRIAKARE